VPTAPQEVIPELAEHLRPIFDQSPDGVNIWLDEQHMACNENLARMFGLTAEEWAAEPGFLDRFVVEDHRSLFSWNYWNRVVPLSFPATFRFTGIRKDGATFEAETYMIPLSYGGHTVAYHFVRRVSG